MKQIIISLAAFCMLVSCTEKETPAGTDESAVKVSVTTGEATDIDPTSAKFNGMANISNATDANGTAYFYYSSEQSDAKGLVKSGARVSVGSISNSDSAFSETVSNLTPDTKYYYMASVSIDEKEFNGTVKSFTTAQKPKELSVTGAATDITEFKAKLSGYANLTPDLGNVTMGILYSTEENPTLANGVELTSKELDENNMYTVQAKDLKYNTVYYYKSFVQYGGVYRFGTVKTFSTRDFIVTAIVSPATEITSKMATLNGKFDVSSVEKVSMSVWFYYGTMSDPNELYAFGKGQKIVTGTNGVMTYRSTDLLSETTYYYFVRAYVHDKEITSEIECFTTKALGSLPAGAVDLGLSVYWASFNLGESGLCTNQEESGDYYAWGETETKDTYDHVSYKWFANGNYPQPIIKYNTSTTYGTIDNKMVLEAEDDVAHVKLGGNWRMPTYKEWAELISQCTWTETSHNGVKGRLVTSGKNGNSIFLPGAGHRDSSGQIINGDDDGYYWSSYLYKDDPAWAWGVSFIPGYSVRNAGNARFIGLSIRPVSE